MPQKNWWVVSVVAIVALLFLATPVVALMFRVPWADFFGILRQEETLSAAGLSLLTSGISAALCVLMGTAIALWLSSHSGVWAALVRVLVIVPLVLPPLVGGVALLSIFGRRGFLGPTLDAINLQVPFTTAAVVMAQMFVALPFMVITVEAAQRGGLREYSRIAMGLGAPQRKVLSRITLPLLRPAIVTGALLCFARAMGEYGATAIFAGNTAGVSRTLPQAIASAFQGTALDEQVGYVMAGLLVLCAVLIVIGAGMWRNTVATARNSA